MLHIKIGYFIIGPKIRDGANRGYITKCTLDLFQVESQIKDVVETATMVDSD